MILTVGCCYKRKSPPDGKPKGCQFNFSLQELWFFGSAGFCKFHLPWNSDHARSEYGLDMPEENLKCNWTAHSRESFLKEVLTRLDQNSDLAGTVFPGDFVVSNSPSQVNLSGSFFPGSFSLPNSHHVVDLSYSTAVGKVRIGGTIHKECNLTSAEFGGYVDCRSASMHSVICRETIFLEGASFVNCTFGGFANFSSVVFLKPVTFEGANFSGTRSIGFRGAKFFEAADFRTGDHRSTAGMRFNSAIFFGKAGFEGRDFKSYLEFRDTVFHEAPRFHDAEISFESTFPPSSNFLDQKYIPYRIWKASPNLKRQYYEEAAQAYRALRFAMKGQEAHDEEARFWQLEMKAKENSLGWKAVDMLPWIFSKLYFWAARYGNSIGLPLLWWTVLTCIAAAAIYFAPLQTQSEGLLQKAIETSIQQTTRPFWVWTDEGSQNLKQAFPHDFYTPSAIVWFRFVATVQSILCLTLVALFGFALRRKFRMA